MKADLPRIETISAAGPLTLRIRWRGKRTADEVNLAGWVATGGDILSPLREPETFKRASVGGYGSFVTWDDGEGDLAIDAVHLKQLVEEQKPFGSEDVSKWQDRVRLSNNEVADLLGCRRECGWNSDGAVTEDMKLSPQAARSIG